MRDRFAFLPSALLLALPMTLHAQNPPQQQACAAAEYSQFDFWVGEWEVTGANGQRAGSNRITRVADRCGILEEWTSASGSGGVSINYFEPRTRTWNQHWVGAGGMILHLRGELQDGSMVMQGERQTPQGTVRDRIRWVPESGDRVRQIWDVSSDDGRTWQPAFNGLYVRRR